MLTTPFLTTLDERAAVRGSRDPLGLQPVWMLFGRRVVGNLTTQTTSVRDFTIAMLGFAFAEQLAIPGDAESEEGVFLRWEQLASYARARVLKERGFRGTDRVSRTFAERGVVRLSVDRQHQTLSDQKRYGILGLYSVASRESGLFAESGSRLTPEARAHVESELQPRLPRRGTERRLRLEQLLRGPSEKLDWEGRDAALLRDVASCLAPGFTRGEREFYREHLLFGGPRGDAREIQRRLVGVLDEVCHEDGFELPPSVLLALRKEAAREAANEQLVSRLDEIGAIEPVLALASSVFGWLLVQKNAQRADLAAELKKAWGVGVSRVRPNDVDGLRPLLVEAVNGDAALADDWCRLAALLHSGDYDALLAKLLELHARVMTARNGSAPWAEWSARGRLRVRMRDERATLPDREQLPQWWRHTYFMGSLWGISRQLRQGTR